MATAKCASMTRCDDDPEVRGRHRRLGSRRLKSPDGLGVTPTQPPQQQTVCPWTQHSTSDLGSTGAPRCLAAQRMKLCRMARCESALLLKVKDLLFFLKIRTRTHFTFSTFVVEKMKPMLMRDDLLWPGVRCGQRRGQKARVVQGFNCFSYPRIRCSLQGACTTKRVEHIQGLFFRCLDWLNLTLTILMTCTTKLDSSCPQSTPGFPFRCPGHLQAPSSEP